MTLKEYDKLKKQDWIQTEYIKDINGNVLATDEDFFDSDFDLLKDQILFDILQTLIEIKDELKTKNEK